MVENVSKVDLKIFMKIFIAILLFIPSMLFAQAGNYIIQGNISNSRTPFKAYLLYNTGAITTIDSVVITNNKFLFKGKITEPVHANLVLDHQGTGLNSINPATADKADIYLEKGSLNLAIKDSLSSAVFSGSVLNSDYRAFQALLKPGLMKFNKMMEAFYALPSDQQNSAPAQADIRAKYKDINTEQRKMLAAYVRSNPDKLVSLDALKIYGGNEPDVNEVEPLFNHLSARVKQTMAARSYAAILRNFRITAIGSIAPDFIQNNPEGKPVRLSSFRGKYVLLDFWASWCGPCRQENPNVVSVYNQYKDKNFTVLGVSLDRPDARKAWLKAIEDDKLSWTQVSDLKYWKNAVAIQYGIQAIPQNFLLDPMGKIIAKNLRGEDLKQKLAELIK